MTHFRRKHRTFNMFRLNHSSASHRLVASANKLPVLGGVSGEEAAALEATPERVRLVSVWLHRALATHPGCKARAQFATCDGLSGLTRPGVPPFLLLPSGTP